MAHSALTLHEAVTTYYTKALEYAFYRKVGSEVRGTIAVASLTVHALTEADCRSLMAQALEQWIVNRLSRGQALPRLYWPRSGVRAATLTRRETIYQFLRDHPHCTLQQIADHIGVSTTTVVNQLHALLSRGTDCPARQPA